jgi:sodium-dependent dicarboxylate transporter 2/3/5
LQQTKKKMSKIDKHQFRPFVRFPIIIVSFIILLPFLFISFGDSRIAARSAGVAIVLAILWVSEAIPLAVTALLPLILHPLLGIATPNQVAKAYFNDTR